MAAAVAPVTTCGWEEPPLPSPCRLLFVFLTSDCVFPLNVFAGGQAYKLIMEYVPLGSLKEYLPRHKKVTSLNTLLNYSMQICKVKARASCWSRLQQGSKASL